MANEQFQDKLAGVRERLGAVQGEIATLYQPGAVDESLLGAVQQAEDSATIAGQLANDAEQFASSPAVLPPPPTAEQLGAPDGTVVKQVLMIGVALRLPQVEAGFAEAMLAHAESHESGCCGGHDEEQGGCGDSCGCGHNHGDAASSRLPLTPAIQTCRTPDQYASDAPVAGAEETGELNVPAEFFGEGDTTRNGAHDPSRLPLQFAAFLMTDVPVVIETGIIHDDVLAVAERYLQGAEQLVAYVKDPTQPNPAEAPIISDTPPVEPGTGTC